MNILKKFGFSKTKFGLSLEIFKRSFFSSNINRSNLTLQSNYRGSSILIDSSIFMFAGYGPYWDYSIERMDLKDLEISETEVIGSHKDNWAVPVLFQVSEDYCIFD